MLPLLLLLAFLPGPLWASEVRPRPASHPETRDRTTYVYGGLPVEFGHESAYADLYVDDTYIIDSVRVGFTINHTYDGDVSVTLIAPDGTQVVLAAGVGGNGQDFLETNFSDGAATPIWSGTAPFTGTFQPAQPLSALIGRPTQGVWRLWLQDNYPMADDGTLTAWSLTVIPVPGGYAWGRVTALATGQPLAGVRIALVGGQAVFSDSVGHYCVWVREGVAHVQAQLAGWCQAPTMDIQMNDGDSLECPFALRRPQLTVDRTSLSAALARNISWSDTIEVGNAGDCDLLYSLVETVPWLEATSLSDTLTPSSTRLYAITYHTVLLSPGDYQTLITISHNGLGPAYQLPVYVYVWPASEAAELEASLPAEYRLLGSYPNPFNGETRIRYALPQASAVRMELFNLQGQRVALLAEDFQAPGYHSVRWDGTQAASGIYLVRLTAGEYTATRRLLLMR